MPLDRVEVEGLREFRRELKRLDHPQLTNDLKDVNVRVAELVRVAAVARSRGQGAMASRAADTLRAARQAARAALILGNTRTPFALGAEFGSGRNKLRMLPNEGTARLGWNQFKPWRGSGQGAGYFLYPAIREKETEAVEMFGDEITKLAQRAFPD